MSDSLALGGGPYHFLCQKLLQRGVVEHRLREQLLQLLVLVLQRLQPRLRHVQAAVLGLPVVQRSFRDPCLRARSAVFAPRLMLPRHRNDLLFRKPASAFRQATDWLMFELRLPYWFEAG